MKIDYIPTKQSENVKFYILPIKGTCILGGDWLRGNSINLDYQTSSLLYRSSSTAFTLPLY